MELRGLSLGRFKDGFETRRSYSPGSDFHAGHRVSDSQSSLCSYGSSSSEPHSRASSTTTLSDDRSLLLMPHEEPIEEGKLTTVQEEASWRYLSLAAGDSSVKSPPTSNTARNRRASSQKAARGRQRSDTVPASKRHSGSTIPKGSAATRCVFFFLVRNLASFLCYSSHLPKFPLLLSIAQSFTTSPHTFVTAHFDCR